ncbi:MAG: hypothetical protein KF779_10110 [Hyphomonadaceae bacterium]|nr:hypothetical protein [Hyphomonadaceae bacterium]MCA8885672.1 hypothetical protein [Hyphomonadaceae bacterium]
MKRLPALAFAMSLALVACGQREPTHDMSPSAPANAAREDADFAMRLILIEGHLQVGRDLMEAGQTQNALPHFGHPVRELYSDMIPVIVHRNGQQFDRDLIALEGLAAQQQNSETFRSAFDAALAKVHAAHDLIPAEKWASDEFVLGIVADTASVAAQEYRNALVAGRIDSLIEYHDARGFVLRLSDLLAAHHGSDPRLAQAAAIVAELRGYVGSLTPPDPPSATDAQFEQKAAELRALVGAAPAP